MLRFVPHHTLRTKYQQTRRVGCGERQRTATIYTQPHALSQPDTAELFVVFLF